MTKQHFHSNLDCSKKKITQMLTLGFGVSFQTFNEPFGDILNANAI